MDLFSLTLSLTVECKTLTGSTHDGTRVKQLLKASFFGLTGSNGKKGEPSWIDTFYNGQAR